MPPLPESAVQIPEWTVEQLGGADASEADILSLMAWWQVEQWELATVAMPDAPSDPRRPRRARAIPVRGGARRAPGARRLAVDAPHRPNARRRAAPGLAPGVRHCPPPGYDQLLMM
ncbi:hypothetical protein ACU686_14255 [Yinghuangia aomiensis]